MKAPAGSVVLIAAHELEAMVYRAVASALEAHSGAGETEVLDAHGAAAILGVHRRTVVKLASSGRLPGMRVGRLWRFQRSAVEAYIANGAR